MIDRIKSIMDYYHLSPAQFADKIGFQRSALSHVLSGRNKASLDFVLKVKNAFPNLNLEWLTLGEGNKFINPEDRPEVLDEDTIRIDFDSTKDKDDVDKSEESDVHASNSPGKEMTAIEPDSHKRETSENIVYQKFSSNKSIRKVILLYDDGSFSEHIPEK